MRKFKMLISIVLFISVCLGITALSINANTSDGKKWFQSNGATDAYVFPTQFEEKTKINGISANTFGEEEATLNKHSNEDWIELYQVPNETLSRMSTEGLIETCLSYPQFGDMLFYDSMQNGLEKIFNDFNGLQELSKRKDIGEKLFNFYKNIDLDKVVKSSDMFALRMRYLENIISQESILKSMNKETRNELITTCVDNIKIKYNKYPNVFSIDSTLLIIGRISLIDNEDFVKYVDENEKLQLFLEDGNLQEVTGEEWASLQKILNIKF